MTFWKAKMNSSRSYFVELRVWVRAAGWDDRRSIWRSSRLFCEMLRDFAVNWQGIWNACTSYQLITGLDLNYAFLRRVFFLRTESCLCQGRFRSNRGSSMTLPTSICYLGTVWCSVHSNAVWRMGIFCCCFHRMELSLPAELWCIAFVTMPYDSIR